MKNSFFRGGFTAVFIAIALAANTGWAAATITGFEDLPSWSGSGGNQSGLVIQWNNGAETQTLAWGFNWTGSATVYDMLVAVTGANVGLYARVDSATGFGPGIFGLGYHVGTSGSFGVSGAVDILGSPTTVTFTNGLSDMNTNPATTQAPFSSLTAAPSNPGDLYMEGWMDNGFWELYLGAGTTYPGPSGWTSSLIGPAESLANNGWYAFSITSPSYDSYLPGEATAAVPEPSTLALGGLGLLILIFHARRRIHAH